MNTAFATGYLHFDVQPNISNKIEKLICSKLNNLQSYTDVSTDFYNEKKIVTLDEIQDLIKYINQGITIYSKSLNSKSILESKISNYWVQDYTINQFHSRHNHGRSELSAVYWVRANNKAGKFRLYNPNYQTSLWYSEIPQEQRNVFSRTYIDIVPNKGGIIIFPSYMDHEVLPGEKGCERTTIAFNID